MSIFNCFNYTHPNLAYPFDTCNPIYRADKLCRVIFLKCDKDIPDFCNDETIETYLQNGWLRPTPMIRGELDVNTSKRNGMPCEASKVVSAIYTLKFIDAHQHRSNYNYTWYNLIQQKSREWRVGWLTEDQVFGFYKFSLFAQETITNTPTSPRRKTVEIEFNSILMPEPIQPISANLNILLNAYMAWNAETGQIVVDVNIICPPIPAPEVFWNTMITVACPGGTTGSPITIGPHTYSSPISIAVANAIATDAAAAMLTCLPATTFTFCVHDPSNQVYFCALGLTSNPYPWIASGANNSTQLLPLTLPTNYMAGSNGFFGNMDIYVNGLLAATSVNGAYSGSFLVSPGDVVSYGAPDCV
jgi:hypothetical protein